MTPPDTSPFLASPKSRHGKWPGIVLAVVVLGGLAFSGWRWLQPPPLPEGISQAEFLDAERRIRLASGRRADRYDALSLLGEEAVSNEQLETALACFGQIPMEHSRHGLSARLHEGQVFVRLNRVREAEAKLREYVEHADRSPPPQREHLRDAYKWLTYLLSVELRFEERKAVLLEIHAAQLADVFDSKQLCFPHLLIWHTETGREPLTRFLEHDPHDSSLRLTMARYDIYDGKVDEAREILEKLRSVKPEDRNVMAALLERHFEAHDEPALFELAKSLTPDREDEPWLLLRMRGEIALLEERWENAVRYFERLQKVDPANPWAQMGLSKAYGELGRPKDREASLQRSLALAKIRVSLATVREDDPQASSELASICEDIGFQEAARVFRQHAERLSRPATKPLNSPPGLPVDLQGAR